MSCGWVGASASADADEDGVSNLAEYLAGTDPRNAQSLFRILGATNAPAGMTVRFNSVTNRFYTLQYRDSAGAGTWTNVVSQIDLPGNGGVLLLNDPDPVVQTRYYRVSVRP